jgi:hypothetical protein
VRNRGDHTNLSAGDDCYFLYEYASGLNYDFSSTNNLISNLKKKPSQAASPGYHYKRQAIVKCARELRGLINPDWLKFATLVPVPPSKARGHPDYDDRMLKICQAIQAAPRLDVREAEALFEKGCGIRVTPRLRPRSDVIERVEKPFQRLELIPFCLRPCRSSRRIGYLLARSCRCKVRRQKWTA